MRIEKDEPVKYECGTNVNSKKNYCKLPVNSSGNLEYLVTLTIENIH